MASYYSQLESSIKTSESEILRLQKALQELKETKKLSPQEGAEVALSPEEILELLDKEQTNLEVQRELLANYNIAARNIFDLRKLREENFSTPEIEELNKLLKEETDPRIRVEIEEEIKKLEQGLQDRKNLYEQEKAEKIAIKEEAVRASIALLSNELAEELRQSFINNEMDNFNTSEPANEETAEKEDIQLTKPQDPLQTAWDEINEEYIDARDRLNESIKSFQSIYEEERRIREDDAFKTEEELESFIDEYMRLKIKENENYEMAQREMKNAEKRMRSLERKMREYATLTEKAKEYSIDVESYEKIRRVVEDKKTLSAIYEKQGLGEVTRRTKAGKEQAAKISDEATRKVIEQLKNDGIIVTDDSTSMISHEEIKNDVINSINIIYGTNIATRTAPARQIKMSEEKKDAVEEKQRIKVKVRKVPRNGTQPNKIPGPAPRGIPMPRNNEDVPVREDSKSLVKEDPYKELRPRFPVVEPFTEVKARKIPEIRITEPPMEDITKMEESEDPFKELRPRFPVVEPFTEVKTRKIPEIRITEPPMVDATKQDEKVDPFKELRPRFPAVEPFTEVKGRRITPTDGSLMIPQAVRERKIVDDNDVESAIREELSKVKITENDREPSIERLQKDQQEEPEEIIDDLQIDNTEDTQKPTQELPTTPVKDENIETEKEQETDIEKEEAAKEETDSKTEEKAENKEKEVEPKKTKKGLITIIDELTDGLEIGRKDGTRYQASNIRVMKSFQEELSSGNILYNIVRTVPAIVRVPINLLRKISNKIMLGKQAKATAEILRERLNNLPEEDLMTIYQEYRSNRVIQERFPTLLNSLINERIQKYVLSKVSKINNELEHRYANAYGAIRKIEAIDHKLANPNLDESTRNALGVERNKILSGQAENIASIRRAYIESNSWLSGGSHGFSEDMKASATKLSIIGKRFAKDYDLDKELLHKQAQLERAEMQAIVNGDNEMALRVFIQAESLLSANTEIKGSIFGKRSTGKKYYSPLAEQLDYHNDPFVRDIFTTVALASAIIGTTSALTTEDKNVEILNEQQAAIQRNEEIMRQVNETGNKITTSTDSYLEGLKYRTSEDAITATTLDINHTSVDQTAESFYETFYDSTTASLEKIATDYAAGTITQTKALELMSEISANTQKTLSNVTEECLKTLNQYAPVHKQFDIESVQEAMTYLVEHPEAISKMNQAAVDISKAGESLKGLEFQHVATINALPLNMQEQLMSYAATAALAVNVSKTMHENTKKGEYGNSVTAMVDEYVESHKPSKTNPKVNTKN